MSISFGQNHYGYELRNIQYLCKIQIFIDTANDECEASL